MSPCHPTAWPATSDSAVNDLVEHQVVERIGVLTFEVPRHHILGRCVCDSVHWFMCSELAQSSCVHSAVMDDKKAFASKWLIPLVSTTLSRISRTHCPQHASMELKAILKKLISMSAMSHAENSEAAAS